MNVFFNSQGRCETVYENDGGDTLDEIILRLDGCVKGQAANWPNFGWMSFYRAFLYVKQRQYCGVAGMYVEFIYALHARRDNGVW